MRLIDAEPLRRQIDDLEFKCRKMIWSGGELYVECLRTVQKIIDDAPTIAAPLNDPLTLDELRNMRDVSVWVVGGDSEDIGSNGYAVVDFNCSDCVSILWPGTSRADTPRTDEYGRTWTAYRRRPQKEGD